MDFSVNINLLGIPDGVRRALQDATERCHGYGGRRTEDWGRSYARNSKRISGVWKWGIRDFYGDRACTQAGKNLSAGAVLLWLSACFEGGIK